MRPPRAGLQFPRPDRAHGIRPWDDAADERGTRVPLCPLGERLSRRSLWSSIRPLCGTPPFAQHGRSAPGRRSRPGQIERSTSHVPSQFLYAVPAQFRENRVFLNPITCGNPSTRPPVVRSFFTPFALGRLLVTHPYISEAIGHASFSEVSDQSGQRTIGQ